MINPSYTKGQEMIYDYATMELLLLKEILAKKFLNFSEDAQFFHYLEEDLNI
jgi:hypothetical protein